jgi:hypothetical protein
VQDQLAMRHRADRMRCTHDIDENRLRGQILLERLLVGMIDQRMADQRCERESRVNIAECGRLPVQIDDVAAGEGEVIGKTAQACVHHVQWLGK